jgi:inorganic pyrophosphatase
MARRSALALGLLFTGACAPVEGSPKASPSLCQVATQSVADGSTFLALIEIPKGERIKYEFDAATGRLQADRVLPESHDYPANYGALPCTLAGDGDPLDFLLLSDLAYQPGTLVELRPIGVLRLKDRGDADDKILAVIPSDSVTAVPAEMQLAISEFFRTYKGPDAGQTVGPWDSVDSARAIIRDAIIAARRP